MSGKNPVSPENMSSPLLSILEELDIDILITDFATDEILFINKRMRNEYGITTDPRGQACWAVLSGSRDGRCQSCPVRELERNDAGVLAWEMQSDVTGKHYRKLDKVITWLDGRRACLQQSFDISQDKQNESRLDCAIAQAEKASKAKGDFLSRMSHEIRTPINAIIGMTHIALGAQTLEKAKQCMKKIDTASKQLLGIINDILDVSKLENQTMTITSEEFDFEKMIVEVANIISVKSDEKYQVLRIHMDMNMPKYLIGDSLRISQILLNLLSNAVKFTPEYGKIVLAIERVTEKDGYTLVKMSVSDTGIGIAQENLHTLFDSFEQAEGGFARRFGGTGLGLAICKNLLEMMGGTISVMSEVDKGSTFTCELRLKNAGSRETVSAALAGGDNPRAKPPDDNDDRDRFKIEKIMVEEPKMDNMNPGINDLDIKAYVNSEEALARVRGNTKVYKALLGSFLKSTQIQQMKAEIEAGDFDAAAKSAHAIKGVSANLSLPAVNELSILLESQLKSGLPVQDSFEKMEEAYSKTADCIQVVLSQL